MSQRNLSLFRPAAGLTYTTISLLIVWLIMDFVGLFLECIDFAMGSPIGNSENLMGDNPETMILAVLYIGSGFVLLFLFLLCALFFSMWAYRMRSNLDAFGLEGLKHSPAGAVGWYFVPFACLFVPFQAMAEIWKGSDPAASPEDPTAWQTRPLSIMVTMWWIFWIVSNLIGSIVIFVQMRPEVQTSPFSLMASIFVFVLDVINSVLAVLLVFNLNKRQNIKHQELAKLPV